MFRAVPGRVAGRGGAGGGCSGSAVAPGSSRGVKGRAPGQSPRGRVTIPAPCPLESSQLLRPGPQQRGCRGSGAQGLASLPPTPPLYPGIFFYLQQAICQRQFGTKEGAVGGLL